MNALRRLTQNQLSRAALVNRCGGSVRLLRSLVPQPFCKRTTKSTVSRLHNRRSRASRGILGLQRVSNGERSKEPLQHRVQPLLQLLRHPLVTQPRATAILQEDHLNSPGPSRADPDPAFPL